MPLTIMPTDRLKLSLLGFDDAELFFEVDQDEEVMRYINGGKRTSMQQITEVMLPRMAKYRRPEQGYGIWQIRRRHDNAYIGWVLVRPMGFNTDAPSTDDIEIGWRLKREFWGLGYASEAAQAVADAVVGHNRAVKFVSAIAMPDNAGSIGVMRKLGMQFVKRFLHRDALGDVDAVLYRKNFSASAVRHV